MGMSWAEHSVEIEAPVETSFDAIVDYESFPGWQDAVDSVEVLSRTKDGLGEQVRLFVDAKVRKIDYVLRYRYRRPTRIEWDFVEGNGMRNVDGVYTLEELGPERSRATYKLGADPEIPVPGMVLRRTHKGLVKRSVEDLKREAERRFARAAPAGPGVESQARSVASAAGARPTATQPPRPTMPRRPRPANVTMSGGRRPSASLRRRAARGASAPSRSRRSPARCSARACRWPPVPPASGATPPKGRRRRGSTPPRRSRAGSTAISAAARTAKTAKTARASAAD